MWLYLVLAAGNFLIAGWYAWQVWTGMPAPITTRPLWRDVYNNAVIGGLWVFVYTLTRR
jgi:hypothetical protein